MFYFPKSQLRNAGMNQEQLARLESLINKWIRSNGSEWTCARLKHLKAWYVSKLMGKPIDLSWIATRKDGRVKGPLRAIFQLKKPRKVLNALMIYTGIKLPAVSMKQWKKFYDSVTTEPEYTETHLPFLALEEVKGRLVQDLKYLEATRYSDYSFTGLKKVPDSRNRSVPNVVQQLFDDFQTTVFWDFIDDEDQEGVIAHVLDDLYPMLRNAVRKLPEKDNVTVGKIGVIQEKGAKARFIAMPKLCFQLASLPLGKSLFSMLKRLPWDYTHDQNSGRMWAQAQVKGGKKMYVVDLSDASNNIPWESQKKILTILGVPEPHIRVMNSISRGLWHIPKHVKPRGLSMKDNTLVWKKGQPLGCMPSFAAFALWHGLLLRGIEITLGVKDTFAVVGDDVLINNGLVYYRYRQALDMYKIPVSDDKTFVGTRAAEFLGYIFTPKSSMLARKVLSPTKENYTRYIAGLIDSVRDIRSPVDLVCYAFEYLNIRNNVGLTLAERAALLRLVIDLQPEVTQYRLKASKAEYNSLKYFLLNETEKLWEKGVESSVQFEQRVQEMVSAYPVSLGHSNSFECSNIEQIALTLRMDRFRAFRDCAIGCLTFYEYAKNVSHAFEKVPGRPVRYLIKKALKTQLRDFKKSKCIIEAELLDYQLKILEQSDIPF